VNSPNRLASILMLADCSVTLVPKDMSLLLRTERLPIFKYDLQILTTNVAKNFGLIFGKQVEDEAPNVTVTHADKILGSL